MRFISPQVWKPLTTEPLTIARRIWLYTEKVALLRKALQGSMAMGLLICIRQNNSVAVMKKHRESPPVFGKSVFLQGSFQLSAL